MQKYHITVDGKQYTGSAEDIARWYCLEKGIKLYIEPVWEDGPIALHGRLHPGDERVTVFGYFGEEGEFPPIELEQAYRIFFKAHIQGNCKVVEVGDITEAPVPPFTPERDLSLAAAVQITSAAMERGYISCDVKTVAQYIREMYPQLLNVRNAI